MSTLENYQRWLDYPNLEAEYRDELVEIKGNMPAIEERFYADLEFGTAGLRGILGAGINRMNTYVVARATRALGAVVLAEGQAAADRGVAIAYDCRICSPEFAELAARTLAGQGIKVYLFESLRPTPELSFAVRYYGCKAGINVTASHNPKNYNGYKVYWEEGSQILDDIADKILAEIKKLDLFADFPLPELDQAIAKGMIEMIGHEVDEVFYEKTAAISLRDEAVDKSIGIVYTPLNGAGYVPVTTMLDRMGYTNVHVVEEQALPDGTFPTIDYPNPEDREAFRYAERLAKKVNADILIATDPDCDRLAVEVLHQGEIVALNGNQTGVLLINYLLEALSEQDALPKNAAIVKSIVTSEMGRAVTTQYGVTMFDVLTGFKNICALPNEWDRTKAYTYLMGFEESIGYNIGDHLRDKDAVAAALLLAEMAGYYKTQGKTLVDVLEDLFENYGYYAEKTVSIVLEGIAGKQRIARMMTAFRDDYPKEIKGVALVKVTDYQNSKVTDVTSGKVSRTSIEQTNCIKFTFDDSSWYALRPSGTEPKIKLYIYTKADNKKAATAMLAEIEKAVSEALMQIE